MSHALVRRNSSKQGLQNLMKLTAQRSIEDAEEVERERRRRAREEMRRRDSGSVQGESPESDTPTDDSQLDGSYKPSSSPSLEEDEGFSDWTQRRERQRQQRLQELNHLNQHHQQHNGAEDEEEEEYDTNTGQGTVQGTTQPSLAASRLQKQELERQEMERRKQRQEEAVRAERTRREREREEQAERAEREEEERRKREEVMKKREEESRKNLKPNTENLQEKRKEMKVSYTSRVVLNQEPKHASSNGNASPQEKVSHISSNTTSWTRRSINRVAEPEESEAILETEQRLEKIRRGLQEKESQEMEQLRQRQAEAEQELEELKRKREERRRIREEEERRRGQEEQSRLAKEEEEKRQMKEDIERRRMEAAERMKSLSTSCEGDETFSPFSPKTPTHKITERTESLNRSLKKSLHGTSWSNSFKKTPPLMLTSKIDDKLEQYTHAIETSSETRPVKAAPNDLPSAPEVATKKTLFEAGEVFCQSPTKAPGCKDTDSLKVGVANLITQWVKTPNDSGKQVPGKATDVKPGDVMQKRNMWEGMGETSFRPGQRSRGSTSGKKYKFVVTGHGKYEKIPVDDETDDL